MMNMTSFMYKLNNLPICNITKHHQGTIHKLNSIEQGFENIPLINIFHIYVSSLCMKNDISH